METQNGPADSGLLAILREIELEGATGVLSAQGLDEIVAISFLDGEVVAVDAMSATLREQLGRHLRARELIDSADWEELAALDEPSSRLIRRLVRDGIFGRDRLLEELRELFLGQLREALQWESAEYRFFRSDEVSYERGIRPIKVATLAKLARPPSEPGDQVASPVAQRAPLLTRRPSDWFQLAPLALLVVLVMVLLERPSLLLFPFGWQSEQRSELMREQNAARSANIAQAARSFYLLEGRFPGNPDVLADLGLVRTFHLADALGRSLDIVATEVGFEIVARDPTEAVTDVLWIQRLAGDFLLDRDFSESTLFDQAPLILLD